MYPYRRQPHAGVETAWQAKQASRVRPGGGRTCVRASYIKHDRQALQRLGTTALARRILENPRSRNRREGLRRAVRGYLELDARPTQPQLSSQRSSSSFPLTSGHAAVRSPKPSTKGTTAYGLPARSMATACSALGRRSSMLSSGSPLPCGPPRRCLSPRPPQSTCGAQYNTK